MGTLSKIRSASPAVLGGIAVLFAGFMILSDTDLSSLTGSQQRNPNSPVAVVNGEGISSIEYEQRIREYVEQMRAQNPDQEIDDEQIRDQMWAQMVDEVILRQQMAKMGLSVTDEQIREIMLNAPPEGLQQAFRDSTGQFRKDLYLTYVTNPDKIAEVAGPEMVEVFKKQLFEMQEYLRQVALFNGVQQAINTAGSFVSPSFVKKRYASENTKVDVNYVLLSLNTIADDQVKVSDDEIKAEYERVKELNRQKPARKLKLAIFPIRPDGADSARLAKRVDLLKNNLSSASSAQQRDSIFSNYVAEFNGTKNSAAPINDIDPETAAILAEMQPGDVRGPIPSRTGTRFVRLDERTTGTNEVVKASHILIQFNNNEDSAKAEAAKIMAKAKGGESFSTLAIQYSQDPGSAQRGGDLGYFGKGMMVKEFEEASFAAAPGSIVGPIRTDFGYHIIKVVEKNSLQLAYTDITLALQTSSRTKTNLRRQALELKDLLAKNTTPFDTLVSKRGLMAQTTPFIQKGSPVYGSRALGTFAFEAKVGDVSDPIDMPNNAGIVVAQLAEVREEGVRPLEDMKPQLEAKLRAKKKRDMLKAKADEAYKAASASGSLAATGLKVDSASITGTGQIPNLGVDHYFTTALMSQKEGAITQPIRGDLGYWIAQVKTVSRPDMASFNAQATLASQTTALRNGVYSRWIQDMRDNSNIEDKRFESNR